MNTSRVIGVFLMVFSCAACAYKEAPKEALESAAVDDLAAVGGPVSLGASQAPSQPNALSRKLVRNVLLEIKVQQFSTARQSIVAVTEKAGGYISNIRSWKNKEGNEHGEIEARIPSGQMPGALEQLLRLGDVTARTETVDDVTDQYVDVASRIATQKALEQRLLGLLEKQTGTLQDVMSVESKLAEVRKEIESAEGKMRLLENQIGYATLKIGLYEPGSARDFFDKREPPFPLRFENLKQLFLGSVSMLVWAAVAISPWTVVVLVIVWIIRRRRRRRAMQKPEQRESESRKDSVEKKDEPTKKGDS